MSRQINFYMDKTTEFQFIQFIKNNGFIFIRRSDGKIIDPCENNDLFLFTKTSHTPNGTCSLKNQYSQAIK